MEVFLFTMTYPFGNGEAFLRKEIEQLAENFEKVWVIPSAHPEHKGKRALPENAELVLPKDHSPVNKKAGWISRALSVFFYEFRKSSKRWDYILKFRRRHGNLKYAWDLKERVKRFLKERSDVPSRAIFYSYWYKEWGLALALMKAEGMIHKAFSRAHMGDLYDMDELNMFVPFRSYKVKMGDALFPSSEHGERYLRSEHPDQSHKIQVRYCGVDGPFGSPWTGSEEVFRLVSCSSVTERKRLDRIMEVLKWTRSRIEWVHIGNGPLMDRVKKQSEELPDNVTIRLLGGMPNTEVFAFYQREPVHLFMNASRNEGLPFSMMEAASFGIPLIGPEIFGIPELVNEKTGLLVPMDFDPKKVAEWIERLVDDVEEQKRLRKGAKEVFEARFNGNTQLQRFCEEIRAYETRIDV